jgi:hypothetical protein
MTNSSDKNSPNIENCNKRIMDTNISNFKNNKPIKGLINQWLIICHSLNIDNQSSSQLILERQFYFSNDLFL